MHSFAPSLGNFVQKINCEGTALSHKQRGLNDTAQPRRGQLQLYIIASEVRDTSHEGCMIKTFVSNKKFNYVRVRKQQCLGIRVMLNMP